MVNLKNFSQAQREELNGLARLNANELAQKVNVSNEDAQIFKDFMLQEMIKDNVSK